MGKITQNNKAIILPAPFITETCAPIDTRTTVENLSDLTNPSTFGVNGDYCYIHEGLPVYVRQTKETYTYMGPANENGVLKTNAANSTNWVKTASAAHPIDAAGTPSESVTAITVPANDPLLTLSGNTLTSSDITFKLISDLPSKIGCFNVYGKDKNTSMSQLNTSIFFATLKLDASNKNRLHLIQANDNYIHDSYIDLQIPEVQKNFTVNPNDALLCVNNSSVLYTDTPLSFKQSANGGMRYHCYNVYSKSGKSLGVINTSVFFGKLKLNGNSLQLIYGCMDENDLTYYDYISEVALPATPSGGTVDSSAINKLQTQVANLQTEVDNIKKALGWAENKA